MVASPTPSVGDNVADYLAANGIGKRVSKGGDIYVDAPPKERSSFVLITNTGGAEPEQYFPVDHPTVQVAVYAEAAQHKAAWQRILDCFHLLNRKQNITIGEMDAMYAKALQTPQSLGLDPEKKRWVFTFNVAFKQRGSDGE